MRGKIKNDLLKLARLRTDGGTQPRAVLDEALVAEFAEAMSAGAKFPPMIVFLDGKEHWLADGFHRLAAYTRAGIAEAPCDVQPGGLDQAKWHAAGANRTHGLRRSNADKARAVALALEAMPEASDKEIARHVGVDDKTVGKRRAAMAASAEFRRCEGGVSDNEFADHREAILENIKDGPSGDEGEDAPPAATRQVTRGGKTYPMNVAKIGPGKAEGKTPKKRSTAYKGIAPGKHRFHPARDLGAPVIVHIPQDVEAAVAVLLRALGRPFVENLFLELEHFLKGNQS